MRTTRNRGAAGGDTFSHIVGAGRAGDLVKATGGKVPSELSDADFGPAFTHIAPRSMPMPVLIAVPHAGRAYPSEVLANLRDEELCQLRLEDRHVDQLGVAIAKATGAGLVVANAPRAMLDLNRAHDDVDWDMIVGARKQALSAQTTVDETSAKGRARSTNRRARSGLGLVPRRLPGFGEIWRKPLTREQLEARIEHIHRPYHAFVASELARIGDEWGTALLVDLHSMPPLRVQPGQDKAPHIVLGDRFGSSCDPSLIARALRYLDGIGRSAAHNRPYSGGYVLDRHASPRRGAHAVQLEVCRSIYLDERLDEPSAALASVAAQLAGLVRELGAQTARLAGRGQLDEAAE